VARSLSLLRVGLAFALCGSASCDQKQQEAPGPPPLPSTLALATPAARVAVAGEVAFDLVALPDGALLAWAERDAGLIRMRVQALDASGLARSPARTLAALEPGASVVEVSAAATGSMVAVAWVERGPRATIRAVLGDPAVGSYGEPALVATATIGDAARRGNLAVAADGERAFAFHRGEREPCLDDKTRECTRLAFAELSGTSPMPRRIPLSVPAPCASAIAGFVVSAGRWHYAICSVESGRPRTTTFRIQYEPRYAEAHEVLDGCSPAGATSAGNDVFVVGDCAQGRRAARIGPIDARPQTLDLSRVEVTCRLGHPVLSAPVRPRFELRLDPPRDGLAALLPPEAAPAGARAAWTGTSLVVARYGAGAVALQRWGCRGADWVRIAQ
jgi:hypothetical protein